MTERLYQMCQHKTLPIHKVCEVGVYFPETSNVLRFIQDGTPALLVEADPLCIERIQQAFAAYPQVNIFPVAIWDEPGTVTLYRAQASTFVSTVEGAPALVNDGYQAEEADRFTAEARRFSELDPGDIDLLSIDIEGAEWFVLKHLQSRPLVIALETHAAQYTNPHLPEIMAWMQKNGYALWFLDNTDSVYVHQHRVPRSALEQIYWGGMTIISLAQHRLKAWRRKLRRALIRR